MKVIFATNTILAFMVYYVMSFVFILWSSYMSVSIDDMRSKTKKMDALYVLYLLSIFFIAFSPLLLLDNNHQAHPNTFQLIFVTAWLLFCTFSIVLLNSNKRRDNAAKVCFAIVLINMFVSVGHLYVVLESSRYKFLRCPTDYEHDSFKKLSTEGVIYKTADHPLSCMHELLSPNIFRHDFQNPINKEKFVGSCAFNLPNVSNRELFNRIVKRRVGLDGRENNEIFVNPNLSLTEEELTPYYEKIAEKDHLFHDQFQKEVCDGFYQLMKNKKYEVLSSGTTQSSIPTLV